MCKLHTDRRPSVGNTFINISSFLSFTVKVRYLSVTLFSNIVMKIHVTLYFS